MAFIESYASAEYYNKKARSQEKGRPLLSWGRIKRLADGSFEVSDKRFNSGTMVIGVITPDNKFTFKLNDEQAHCIQNTLSSSLSNALPFIWHRVGKKRWRVIHKYNMQGSRYYEIMRQAPEYFNGITFDLSTGKCVNRKPDLITTVNKEARKRWRGKLGTFKRGIKVRAKMGVFDALYQELMKDFDSNAAYQNYNYIRSHEGVLQLADVMESEVLPTEFLRILTGATRVSLGWYGRPNTFDGNTVVKFVDTLLSTNSISLRKHFNVFDNQGDM